jgi:hypothetical protein
MRSIFTTIITGAICLIIGLCIGTWQGRQLKETKAGQLITSATAKLPWTKATGEDGGENQIESNEYPTLKWRAKQLSDAPDAIVRLWTTFEPNDKDPATGTLKYKLTLFKATKRDSREVQLLDAVGFKLMQFNAGDFQDIPGAPDIVEARDSVPCSEEMYKKACDFSIK